MPTPSTPPNRDPLAEPFDVLIVGGGIVGAGIARDAALRGLRTALVEQYDFASGTSGRSSRLLHGGIRYLAQGRLLLVHEASREKMILQRIAPHLTEPLPFIFPTYRGGTWPLWKLRVGVKLYDMLCGKSNLGPSQHLTPVAISEMLPGLRSDGSTGGVRYFDGLTNDARIVLDTIRSAARAGAIVRNYTQMENASRCDSGWKLSLNDVLSGNAYDATARCVVNATGPWSGGMEHSGVRLRLTKGVHLVVDRSRLPVPAAVVMSEGPRILFAIPWGERVILGTTDTDYQGSLENVRADPTDIAYILKVVESAFPGVKLSEADVIQTWAGLRPLIDSGKGGPSDISRAHQIRMSEPGWLDVAGGKLTTYRLIAQQAVDRLVAYSRYTAKPCRTAIEPLLPPDAIAGLSGIRPPPVEERVVRHACENEWAIHLEDVMIRRTSWHYYHRNAREIASDAARWMADCLGWNATMQTAELAAYDSLPCTRPLPRQE